MYELFTNEATNTTSDAVQLLEAGVDRDWTVHLTGTPGGGTVTIELAPTATGPWAPLDGGSFTDEGVKTFHASRHWYIRAVISGGTGADWTVGVQ